MQHATLCRPPKYGTKYTPKRVDKAAAGALASGAMPTDRERVELEAVVEDLERHAAALPLDSRWRAWLLRRSQTCSLAAGLGSGLHLADGGDES